MSRTLLEDNFRKFLEHKVILDVIIEFIVIFSTIPINTENVRRMSNSAFFFFQNLI